MTPAQPSRAAAPRIYYVHPHAIDGESLVDRMAERAADLGFDHLLIAPIFQQDGDVFRPRNHDVSSIGNVPTTEAIGRLAAACRSHGLRLLMDLDPGRFDAEHPLVAAHPDAFTLRREAPIDRPVDPRLASPPQGVALARLREPAAGDTVMDWIASRAEAWIEAGLDGFRLLELQQGPPEVWTRLIARLRTSRQDVTCIAATPGMNREAALSLASCGFDALISSVAWWDGRAPWIAEEHEDLRLIAPLIAQPEAPFGPRLATRLPAGADTRAGYVRALRLAASTGSGLLLPMGFESAERLPLGAATSPAAEDSDLAAEVRSANRLVAELAPFEGEMRMLTGPGASATALLRASGSDMRTAEAAILVLINRSLECPAELDRGAILPAAGAFGPFEAMDSREDPFEALAPGEVRLLGARRSAVIRVPSRAGRQGAKTAAKAPRLVIEDISPRVSGGPFAAKRIVGETVEVGAAVYADGHEQLAVELRWPVSYTHLTLPTIYSV